MPHLFNSKMTLKRKLNGLTFVEFLVSIVILGIFITVAYPVFTNVVYKTRRIDGQMALLNLATVVRNYYVANGTYLGISMEVLGAKTQSGKGYYVINVPAVYLTPKTFIVTATPIGPQADDAECGTLAINNFGAKGKMVAGQFVPDQNCWQ